MNAWQAQFPCRTRVGALRCWTRGISLPCRLLDILRRLEKPGGREVEVLRAVKRHTVLRVWGGVPEQSTLIVKGFPLGRVKSRLQYRKYGVAEVQNWHEARQRGIPVPDYFGYFEWRTWGLVKANGVFMEDLSGYRSLDQQSRVAGADRLRVLQSAVPLLRRLYETGVNHVDPSPQNMLQSPDGRDLRMIDWEGCAFVRPREMPQLVLHAAHFLNFASLTPSDREWGPWLDMLHVACGRPGERERLHRAVAVLQVRGRVPLRERLGLMLDAATTAALQKPHAPP